MVKHAPVPVEIGYPSSDGMPLAESDFQFDPLAYARNALRDYYRDRSDVYVAGNMLIYYEEGNVKARVAPDVFVVFGAPAHDRSSYLLWREPKGPDWVLEVTSRSTRREDQGRKRDLYRELGVTEYWQYDPTGDYLSPRLRGEELVSGEYRRLAGTELADGGSVMWSRVLGLELRLGSGGLRFRDAATGEYLLNLAESNETRRRTEQGWQHERRVRQLVEQERNRVEQERNRVEQERDREKQARQEAERAAEAAQARVAELEALLARGRGDGGAE